VGIAIAAAVALALRIAHADAWWLPLALAGVVLLLAYCVFVLPRRLAPPRSPEDLAAVEDLDARDRIEFADDRRRLENEIRTALLQAVVGGAVLVGVLFTWQQQQATSRQVADQLAVTRQGQVGERFSRAVGQLGSNSIDVRLGGLYELEQLSRQAPERRLVIIEVVGAYVRQHARSSAEAKSPYGGTLPPQDVAAALTIIGRRSIEARDPPVNLRLVQLAHINLTDVTLPRTDLTGADLSGADLNRADLQHASLPEAKLRGAGLIEADLRGADLVDALLADADLVEADLRAATLNDTYLSGANLERAKLDSASARNADLDEALLGGADLRSVDFSGAVFTSSDLSRADLRFASLQEADLRDAILDGTDLRRAFLHGADLSGATLHATNLRDARADRSTLWPDDSTGALLA